jgi:hypothetical protein
MKEDIRTALERRRGWWIEENATVSCALPDSGLIVVFKREDVEHVLDANYPTGTGDFGQKVWYFNASRDREIAEIDTENRVSANPQILWQHFMGK